MSDEDTLLNRKETKALPDITTSIGYFISNLTAVITAALTADYHGRIADADEAHLESKHIHFEVADKNKIDFSQDNQHKVFVSFSSDEFTEEQKERCIQVTNRFNQLYETEKQIAKENSEYSAELEKIFTQLQEEDRLIAKTRQNTVQLGIETRSMLDDLRKQLG